ncbi:MAG: hypothetical protein ABWY19_07695 [Marmoricola sp.]
MNTGVSQLRTGLVAGLLAVVAALVVLPAVPASAAQKCTTTVTTNADGTTHETVTCVDTPVVTGPDDNTPVGVPQPEYPKTIVTPACGSAGAPGGVVLETMYYCPQPPCPDGTWERFARWVQPAALAVATFAGTFCADPDAAPVVPVVTPEMVTEAAEQVAPKPVANVQPGVRSYVNIPNNYFSEAAPTTIPVTVLGQQIQVTFEPTGDTWDFGDGATATGSGVEDAEVGAAGSVEHAYTRQGSYAIHVSRSYTVRFVLPTGPSTIANAFDIAGPDTVLPVGEIQTRVDSTS